MRYIELDEVYSEKAIREICEEFPFLIPKRNGKIVPDYDYTYLWLEIPRGWYNLFLQMCGDIKPILEKHGLINVFEFEQVKEKYNGLRCYYNFGLDYIYVDSAPQEIKDIADKYEYMAKFVCTRCGDVATRETYRGWISSYCDKCISDSECLTEDILSEIEPEFSVRVYKFSVGGNGEPCRTEETLSFEDEWNRYKNLIGAE